MAYTPYYTNGWQDGSSGGTPITAEALNHMERGVEDNATNAGELSDLTTTAKSNLVAAINELDGVKIDQGLTSIGSTISVKTWALSLPVGFYPFFTSGNYAANELPSGNYQASPGVVYRSDETCMILVYGRGGSTGGRTRIAKCGYYNSAWSNWIEFVGTELS